MFLRYDAGNCASTRSSARSTPRLRRHAPAQQQSRPARSAWRPTGPPSFVAMAGADDVSALLGPRAAHAASALVFGSRARAFGAADSRYTRSHQRRGAPDPLPGSVSVARRVVYRPLTWPFFASAAHAYQPCNFSEVITGRHAFACSVDRERRKLSSPISCSSGSSHVQFAAQQELEARKGTIASPRGERPRFVRQCRRGRGHPLFWVDDAQGSTEARSVPPGAGPRTEASDVSGTGRATSPSQGRTARVRCRKSSAWRR